MMGSRARHGIGAGVAAAALAAAATGCSGGGGGGAAKAGASASASPSESTFIQNPAAVAAVADVMREADAAGTVTIAGSVTSPAIGKMTLSGAQRYRPTAQMSMTLQVQGQTMSEVVVGSTLYLDYPALSAQMGGKPWGRIDLATDDGSLGSLSSLADTTQQYDPMTQIEVLAASGNITDIGTETDQGQQTEHYHGQLILSDLLQDDSAAAGLLTSAQVGALENEFNAAGVSKESVDVWIGADKLPVEIKYETQTPQGQDVSDMLLTGWGKAVQLGAPPANQVFDLGAQIATPQASATAGPSPSPSLLR